MFRNIIALLGIAGLFAGSPTAACAQHAEVSVTDGGVINTSAIGQRADFEGVAFDHQFTLKAGLVLPGRIGIGLFYEQARFSRKQKFPQNNGATLTGIIDIAAPQRTIGLEVSAEAPLAHKSYLRFSALFGYALSRTPDPVQESGFAFSRGFSYSMGFDVSYLFPITGQLSGVLNTGIRYSKASYEILGSGAYINTYSFPLTAGLSYKF